LRREGTQRVGYRMVTGKEQSSGEEGKESGRKRTDRREDIGMGQRTRKEVREREGKRRPSHPPFFTPVVCGERLPRVRGRVIPCRRRASRVFQRSGTALPDDLLRHGNQPASLVRAGQHNDLHPPRLRSVKTSPCHHPTGNHSRGDLAWCLINPEQITHGGANYFGHAGPKQAFTRIDDRAWWRVVGCCAHGNTGGDGRPQPPHRTRRDDGGQHGGRDRTEEDRQDPSPPVIATAGTTIPSPWDPAEN